MMKLWGWFSGKKTGLGAAALMLAVLLQDVIVGEFGFSAPWIDGAVGTLEKLGVLFGGVGLTHKAVKAAPAPEG